MLNQEKSKFDVKFGASLEEDPQKPENKKFNKKILLLLLSLLGIMFTGWFFYKNFITNTKEDFIDSQIFFVNLDEMTINLRTGSDNDLAWLRVKIALEVQGEKNYNLIKKMMPKIIDLFQTYLTELKKSDLNGSFGIYKIKDAMMMRINVILAPAKIENILFQEFLLQGA